MKRYEIIVFSVVLITTGVLLFLSEFGVIDQNLNEILIWDLIAFGILSIYTGFSRGSSSLIFISTASFLTGVFLFVINNYEIFPNASSHFLAINFIVATGLLMIYFQNPKSLPYLFLSLVLYFLSFASITIFKESYLVYLGNGFVKMIISYWPMLLIYLGINIIADSKTK